VRALLAAVVVLCLFSCVDGAQGSPPELAAAATGQLDPQMGQRRNQDSRDEAQMERDMAKQRNKDRQQKLKNDTDRLLKLATELKEYVDKSNEHVLSLDVLKKTDEIEKLAKSVRDRMKQGSYDGVVPEPVVR
jgi:hypothetical protein